MKALVSPWRSKTTRFVADGLGLRQKVLKRVSEFKTSPKLILNWGCASLRGYEEYCKVLNPPNLVRLASDKRETFRVLTEHHVPTLAFTSDFAVAKKWLEKASVVQHLDPRGHSGSGLKLALKGSNELQEGVPLYTRYFPKEVECRVLVVMTSPASTFYMEKKRVLPERYREFGIEGDGKPDFRIRTHARGWIFARDVTSLPEVCSVAVSAISALGLSFGAVDILKRGKEILVGEINTAPGLEGSSADFMVSKLKELV